MLTQLFICIALIENSVAHPFVAKATKDYPLIQKSVSFARSPRSDDIVQTLREGRVDTNCEGILRPANPDCCFMTDPDHKRTKPFGQPLATSPYKISLVLVGQKQLNKFEKAKFNNSDMWKLTPIRYVPNSIEYEIVDGPIKLQIYTDDSSKAFNQFWVQAKKFVAPSSWMLAGSFEEKPLHNVYPNMTMHNGEQKAGCDKDEANNNEKATIVSHANFNEERSGVELAWNPPRKCTEDQLANGETMKCRKKEDLFFFTYTIGNTDTGSFWIGQNSFAFYVDNEYQEVDVPSTADIEDA